MNELAASEVNTDETDARGPAAPTRSGWLRTLVSVALGLLLGGLVGVVVGLVVGVGIALVLGVL